MSRARSVADLGNQNVLTVSATDGNINVGTGVTIENTGEAQFSGIVTAQSIDTRNLIGDVSVGGVLTYEDVTSVDSVGVVTARQGVHIVSAGASIYSPANNALALYTNSSEKVRVESGGNIGIGTDNPNNLLHVYGGQIKAQSNPSDTSTNLDLIRAQCGPNGNALFSIRAVNAADDNSNWDIKTNANEDLTFTIGSSTERLRITSGGNVGIGTDNPGTSLEVFTDDDTDISDNTGTNNTNSILRLYNKNGSDGTGVNNYTGIRFDVASGATSSAYLNYVRTGDNQGEFLFKARNAASSYPELLRIDSSSNVAINYTGTLSSKLTLSIGNVTNRGKWSDCEIALDNPTNVGAYSQIGMGYVLNSTYAPAYMGFLSTNQATFGYGDIVFGTRNVYTDTQPTERMRIDSSGRLLIGNSSDVSGGTTSTAIQITSVGGGYLGLARNDVSVVAGNGIGGLRFYANDPSAFNKVAELSCAADGTHALDDYPTRLLFSTTAVGANSPTERMRISQNGSFNCYTSSNNGFSVRTSAGAGTGAYIYQAYRSASSTTSGTIVYRVYSNGTYATISDATQKKNISTARDGYLKDLNALRVVKYHWNEQDDSEQKELGLIAQEVETVFPGLIAKFDSDSGETIKGVKSSVLTFMLIKALQEATGRIETLEGKVAALEAQ